MDITTHKKWVKNSYPTTVIFNPANFNQRVINIVRVSTSKPDYKGSARLSATKLVIQADAVDS